MRESHSSILAGFLLVLTLGVGIAEAWHGEEEAEEQCVECALCTITTPGPVAEAPEAPDPIRPACVFGAAGLDETPTRVASERRPHAARAPPA